MKHEQAPKSRTRGAMFLVALIVAAVGMQFGPSTAYAGGSTDHTQPMSTIAAVVVP